MRVIVKNVLKWTGIVVIGLAGLALLGIAFVYFASVREFRHTFSPAVASLQIPTDDASIVEGKRLAQLTGCLHCHGDQFGGQFLHDFPNVARFVAPNVSGVIRSYTDTQLEAVIRQGVKSDGRGVVFMPSEMFRHLRDEDVAKIVAYLRTVKPADGTADKTEIRMLGRFIFVKGDFKSAARANESLPPGLRTLDAHDPVSQGKYLAMNLCTECHSQNLEGMPIANSPSLTVAKSYSAEQFKRLMRDGVGLGDREFPLMSPTSKARFAHLTDGEVDALYAFLQARS
jgi:cytochrome c553